MGVAPAKIIFLFIFLLNGPCEFTNISCNCSKRSKQQVLGKFVVHPLEYSVRPAPIMFENLPIILLGISQNFHLFFCA